MRNQVPNECGAYLRILYRFVGPQVVDGGRLMGHQLITWHDMALANGRTPHRLMDIVGVGPDHTDMHAGHFSYQNLAPDQANELFDILQDEIAPLPLPGHPADAL